MFIRKLWAYLLGYLILVIKGEHPERLINLAYTRGVHLWDLCWIDAGTLTAKVYASSFRTLRHIAKKAGCKLRIRRKRGLPFLLFRLRRRRMLLVGAVVFCLILYCLSSFIWTVEVSGTRRISQQKVKELAAEAGLRPGRIRFQVQRDDVVDHLLRELPEIAYAEVDVGPRSRIRISEKQLPEPGVGYCHIVAEKEGVIESVLTLAGQPLVKEGDVVRKGQVLISGEISPAPPGQDEQQGEQLPPRQEPRFVQARGIVHARVWYRFYGEAALEEIQERLTGRKTLIFRIKVPGKEVIVYGPREVPYQFCRLRTHRYKLQRWRNISLPVEFVTIEAEEVRHQHVRRSYEEAVKMAAERAREKAVRGLPRDAVTVRRRYKVLGGDEDPVRVVLTIETRESIGVIRKFRPENQTDKTGGKEGV